jgi:cold shock CspA family protein/ribosome-associated translation inhibitor RaiA
MPDGIMQWFDPATGEGAVVRGGRVFTTHAEDVESGARRAGARVHFDISDDHGRVRASNVTLRRGKRSSPHHARAGTLAGARRPDTKGSAPFTPTHQRLGRSLATHPLEVARVWAECLRARDVDEAFRLYASDAVVHVADDELSGRAPLENFFSDSGLHGIAGVPEVRGEGDLSVVTWPGAAPGQPITEVRSRIEHGLISEQWFTRHTAPRPPTEVVDDDQPPRATATHGPVTDDAIAYAWERLDTVISRIDEPVLFVRLKLSIAADPARAKPALAQVTVDVDGDLVRSHVAAHDPHEAVDLLQRRLRDQLEHRHNRRLALHRSSGVPEPGEWRHGDLPSDRPPFFPRERGDRQLVRHKTFAVDELTPDEAAFDMELADFQFYLFRDLASGEDAVLERLPGGEFRLTRLHPSDADPGPTAIAIDIATTVPASLTVPEAIDRLDAAHEPFVFFANAATGQGNVVYRRYDGHYGLITPA